MATMLPHAMPGSGACSRHVASCVTHLQDHISAPSLREAEAGRSDPEVLVTPSKVQAGSRGHS